MTEQTQAPPLIEFPCDFPIKVVGETHDEFAQIIITLIQASQPTFTAENVDMRASSGGKYISLTCTVRVHSQVHLDEIYSNISTHPLVKFTL